MVRVAFIFPGQGSQYVGMGRDFLAKHEVARSIFSQANDLLNFNIRELCLNGPEEELRLTANTQPAIFLVSLIAYKILEQEGIRPVIAAGHSLGEYSALTAADALDFAKALQLVRRRGELMQEAVPVGKGLMAAVLGLDTSIVEEICSQLQEQGRIVQIANYNCPGQVVISGEKEAVEEALTQAKGRGAKKLSPLPVSAPFHSPLMKPAEEVLARDLEGVPIREPTFPVVTNVGGEAAVDPYAIREALKRQITSPVRWEDCMRYLLGQGIDTVVEVGPGRVLLGLLKRIDRNINGFNVEDSESLQRFLSAVRGGA